MSNIDIDQLTALIEKTVQERTLSIEANSWVEDLKAQNKELTETNKVLQNKYQMLLNDKGIADRTLLDRKVIIEDLTRERDNLKTMIASYEKRLFDLSVGERVVETEHKRREDLFHLVSLVFKNPIVKETVLRNSNVSIPVPSSGYVENRCQSETTTTTTEKE